MRTLVALIVLLGLMACGTGPRTEVVQDPIFPDNFIVYHPDGTKDYMVQDAITSNKDFDNYIIFRGQKHGEKTERP